ncbi:MAG: peptidoglycan-binding domain-containing protein [Polyangiaceae bacterium]
MDRPMLPHVVAQGEHLTKLAFARGASVEEVWNHPKNEAIRALRKDPHVLAPGDVVYLPSGPVESLAITKGATNKYRATVPRVDVHLVLHDEGGGPLANEPYEIEGLGDDAQRTTGGDGAVSFQAPVHLREVTLFFPKKHLRVAVQVGDLDPIEERSGVAGRLRNLGFLRAGSAPSDEEIRAAVRAFQRRSALPETGTLDPDTTETLKRAHGA